MLRNQRAVDAPSIAFGAPDDGWIVTGMGAVSGHQTSAQFPFIYHFDGTDWTYCFRSNVERLNDCADRGRRLPWGTAESAQSNPRGIRLLAAGKRVYLYGTRAPRRNVEVPGDTHWPLLIYRDTAKPCTSSDHSGCWRGGADALDDTYNPTDGGYDPGCVVLDPQNECIAHPDSQAQGRANLLSVFQPTPETFEGWVRGETSRRLLRIEPSGRVSPWQEPEGTPLSDYGVSDSVDPRLVAMPGADGESQAFAVSAAGSNGFGPLLSYDAEEGRWDILPTPFLTVNNTPASGGGLVRALAADNAGGLFVFVTVQGVDDQAYAYHYTRQRPGEAFSEASHPVREPISAAAGGADGSFWVATRSNAIYRYDRVGGWERTEIKGWDPGVRAFSGSPVNALAIGPNGSGVAVGPGGRIADLSPTEVRLNSAAGATVCSIQKHPPCGTGRNLGAAAVAPDGSAMVGGDELALLWKPSGGEFRAIERPAASLSARITSISMPTPDTAYLTTSTGEVHVGERTGESWSWRVENINESGNLTTRLDERHVLPLSSIAVDRDGHGYAAGAGVLYERTPDETQLWRRLATDFPVSSIVLPAGEGSGALFAGPQGLLVTRYRGSFEIARAPDPFDPLNGVRNDITDDNPASVAGMALLPGDQPGEAEAWVVLARRPSRQASGTNDAILHYASDSIDPLLSAEGRAKPLADTVSPRPGEISFAAFGKSECVTQQARELSCPEITGSNLSNERIAMRVAEEIVQRSQLPGGPSFALFSGDVNDGAGTARTNPLSTPADPAPGHRRWRELIAEPLARAGVPLFGALGARDLSTTEACGVLPQTCHGTRDVGGAGPNLAWRQAFSSMPAPWGQGDAGGTGALHFEPVRDEGDFVGEIAEEDERGFMGEARTPLKGARTHYALDAIDATSGEMRARIVVVDNSLRSMSATDPLQNPVEAQGGQAAWLERMLCMAEGPAADTQGCTREPGQLAIVLANTPSYSFGPGFASAEARASLFDPGSVAAGDTQLDSTLFESILIKNHASVAVSGRIGWNALYWTTAPGVHEPCPGGAYPDPADVPEPGTRLCGRSTGEDPTQSAREGAQRGFDAARDYGAAVPPQAEDTLGSTSDLVSVLPNVIASSAGGKLAESEGGDASEGFWHGYTIVRLSEDGDPRGTIVEQRPILDWIGLSAREHTLRPRERLSLKGYGREPPGLDSDYRYDDIDTPAITHRYDLLLADPEEPWLPCEAADPDCEALQAKLTAGPRSLDSIAGSTLDDEDGCDPYLCLPGNVGTIDSQTGEVRAGEGKYPDTFAIALLSVGDRAASWPLAFERSPSFVVSPAAGFPAVPSVPTSTSAAPQPPAPPNPSQPSVPQPSAPTIPTPPPVPPIAASQPPEPQPPAPPAPPPPTEQPSPLNFALAPPSIAIATPTAVIQPPTPPVNPAPPGGARREARQRQAAAQKSGADSDEAQKEGVDLAEGPPAARGEHSMTRYRPIEHHSASSPAAQAALYTGALALIAATLAAGWRTRRPGPDIRPAPETARYRSR